MINRKFLSPHFCTHRSVPAAERVVAASRDRRHRTRRAELAELSAAFSAAGATGRRPGAKNRFPRARLDRLGARSRRGLPAGTFFAPGRRTAARSESNLPRWIVGLGEPRLLVASAALCDQRFAGDGGAEVASSKFSVFPPTPANGPSERFDYRDPKYAPRRDTGSGQIW